MKRYRAEDLFSGREELALLLNFQSASDLQKFYYCASYHPPATLPVLSQALPYLKSLAPSQLALDNLLCLASLKAQSWPL